MRPVIVTFPDQSGLGQAPAPRDPYLTHSQTAAQIRLITAQQQQLPLYLRRIGR